MPSETTRPTGRPGHSACASRKASLWRGTQAGNNRHPSTALLGFGLGFGLGLKLGLGLELRLELQLGLQLGMGWRRTAWGHWPPVHRPRVHRRASAWLGRWRGQQMWPPLLATAGRRWYRVWYRVWYWVWCRAGRPGACRRPPVWLGLVLGLGLGRERGRGAWGVGREAWGVSGAGELARSPEPSGVHRRGRGAQEGGGGGTHGGGGGGTHV